MSIKNRQHQKALSLLALMTASLPLTGHTSENGITETRTFEKGAETHHQLPEVRVKAQKEGRIAPVKVDKTTSVKHTQPILDTPQTLQVINKELIKEQGATSLVEALQNTAGITLQLGENGNTSAGDAIQMRGFTAQNSLFLDGVRDMGAISRDAFNIEQIEVAKGSVGADVGRGTAGGYINVASKLPSLKGRNELTSRITTAEHIRATADINQKMSESSAVRLNAMVQQGGVEGRDEVEKNGYAVAPSVAFGLGTDTRLYLFSQHIKQENTPDGGIPSIGMEGFYNAIPEVKNAPKVDRENFYGHKDDHEDVTSNIFTAKIEHDVNDNHRVTNTSRYGKTQMDRVLTGINTITATDVKKPDTWTISRSRQRIDQMNEILTNQTNLQSKFKTGLIEHEVSSGVEFIYEAQKTLGTGTTAQTIRGINYPAINTPNANLYNPNKNDDLGTPYLTGVVTEGKTITSAIYAFDTLKLTEKVHLSAGFRAEHYNTSSSTGTIVTASNLATNAGYAVGGIAPTNLEDSDTLLSWKVGALYKPAKNGSVYASYATSKTPAGSANFSLSSTVGNANNPALDPQETENFEIGTKWDLLDDKLNISTAVYRTENDKQVTQDPITLGYFQEGKTRVEGIEFSTVGKITPSWQINASVAQSNTKQLNQRSINSSGVISESSGVRWSPEWTASLWNTYTKGAFTVGGGVRYVGEQKRVVTVGTDLSTTNMPNIDAYLVLDAMASYKLNRNATVALNIYNLTDEEYISSMNNSGARVTLGTPLSAGLTLSYKF